MAQNKGLFFLIRSISGVLDHSFWYSVLPGHCFPFVYCLLVTVNESDNSYCLKPVRLLSVLFSNIKVCRYCREHLTPDEKASLPSFLTFGNTTLKLPDVIVSSQMV